ncbi:MAG: hypothetical protein J6A91_08605 [Bacteroidales bacterium]|nr:hypothetical protein [Bacteroidales bacterium]MBP3663489.1 hypothetical protein [Bacteroidales bacterium]
MKKITRLSIFAVALMTLASSCNRDEEGLDTSRFRRVTIKASVAETRTTLDGNDVKWECGDKIDVLFTSDSEEAFVGEFWSEIEEGSLLSETGFKGDLPLDVTVDTHHEQGYAIYPSGSAGKDGQVNFTLPLEQRPRVDGSFSSGVNLSSAPISLKKLSGGQDRATFSNALAVLRFTPEAEATSVTIKGTAPLSGKLPLVFTSEADGKCRLVPGEDAAASPEGSLSATLLPPHGQETFSAGVQYNLLVWPGSHTALSVTQNFGSGTSGHEKTTSGNFVFAASRYYTLTFGVNGEIVVRLEDAVADLEEKLEDLENESQQLSLLLSQIQSVALVSSYPGNRIDAPYSQMQFSKLKMDLELNYMVRPVAAMELLLKHCKEQGSLSQVFSAVMTDRQGGIGNMTVTDAALTGDILTVTVDAEPLSDNFYEGKAQASVALQISDGNTEILSDFASLVPKKGTMMNITKTEDIPVLKGAGMSMGFSFGASDMSKCNIAVENAVGFASTPTVSFNSSGSGFFNASFAENADLSNMSVDLVLTCGEESDRQTLTFAEGGNFVVETSGVVDYIGGEVSVKVVSNDFLSVTSELRNAGDWIYQTYSGNNNTLTVKVNEGQERSAEVVFTIKSTGSITYTKSVSVYQKAAGSAIDESRYHQTKGRLELQAATAGYTPLNIVIIGDGYQKKDLFKGGKFERSARSAMEAFFGVEPYKSFRNRFRVMMVAYESVDEGLSLQNGTQKNTCFKSYYQGSGNTYVNLSGGDYTSVKNVVRNDLGWSDDATYYRTIVIMLINTSEGIGSNAAVYRASYPNTSTLGEPYASFALAMVTANNTETSNLIRHEAGGHAFGRLGDEYPSKEWGSDVNNMHEIGWYRNITVNRSLWNWDDFIGRSGYEDVTYYQPNNTYWCPIDHTKYNSIMYNNTNKFNAPSRQIIYERIIRQTEGAGAYSWNGFLEYDKRNL